MKVLLIQPSTRDSVKTLFSIYNAEEGIGFKPPIGLLYIASVIKAATDHKVDLIDCQLDDVHQGNILEHITDEYDLIGISAWTDFWYQASAMAKRIKEKYPKSHIVIGGPHATIYPEEILKSGFTDSVIAGDGEKPIIALLDHLSGKSGKDKDVPGLYFRDREYKEYLPYICEDLDGLPIPDRSLLPIQRYYSVIGTNSFVTTMITSRGCPYRCVYCKLKFQKPVMRSAENIVKEFEAIYKLGIREIEVYDDTFNWNHDRTLAICNAIIEKGLDIKWAIRDRVDRVREDILVALKKAGCYRIHLGIESGSDRVLKLAKKGITTEQARKAVALAKKHGFIVLTYFMYGLPGETMADSQNTLKFALELDSDYAEFSITIPYPGTEAYEEALREKIIPNDYWHEFTLKPSPSFNIPCVIENLISRKELLRLRNTSIREFYFRPRYILREIGKLRSLPEFFRKFNMAVGLLGLLKNKVSAENNKKGAE